MRYKLRSAHTRVTEPLCPSSPQGDPTPSVSSALQDPILRSPSRKRRKLHRRKIKSGAGHVRANTLSIYSIPEELILLFVEQMDVESALAFFRTCKHFYLMLRDCDTFWRILSHKYDICIPTCLETLPQQKLGYAGKQMYPDREDEVGLSTWAKIWKRGIQMRRNIASSNFHGWRLFSNSSCPLVELEPDLDLNRLKQNLQNFPRLSKNDDLKLDWDEKYLVVFHLQRGDTESCTIRLWDIEDKPNFMYEVDKGRECITDKVAIHAGYVVIVPSWPLDTQSLVMTLDIANNMQEKGRYIFSDEDTQLAVDDNWDHTQLRVVKCHALVTCRAPDWRLLITSLPDCQLLTQIKLSTSNLYECQQIRSHKDTALILFSKDSAAGGDDCCLVTVDVNLHGANVRSTYYTSSVTDVAVYTEPEEIYLVRKDGSLMMYDATTMKMTLKIVSNNTPSEVEKCDFLLFVNGKEQIFILQSAPEAPCGRSVRVYSYQGKLIYTINLDLVKYGLSRNESVCIYTNSSFLLVADAAKFVLFDVNNGRFISVLHIPCHIERSKGKVEKDCMFDQSSLGMLVFDENRLIAVHDYERNFPAVLDILNFW